MRFSLEHVIQKQFMQLAYFEAKNDERWELIFAIPNGGNRTKVTGGILKAEGVKAGMPDIVIPISLNGYSGMMIEFKRPKTAILGSAGRVSPEQKSRHALLKRYRWKVEVCYDALAAFNLVKAYFSI